MKCVSYYDFNEFIPLFTSQHSYLRPVNTTRTGQSVMPPLPELCPASHFWRLPSQFACSKISGFSVIGKSKFLSRERYLIISSFSLLALARKLQQRSRYFVWFTLQLIPCWFQLGCNISGLIRILYLHIMSCWKFGWRDLRFIKISVSLFFSVKNRYSGFSKSIFVFPNQ